MNSPKINLSVNLNKIALIRNSRKNNTPDLKKFVDLAIKNNVNGITVHPRPDGRHILKEDVFLIADILKEYPEIEFNIEGNPFYEVLELVKSVKPDQFTLVPDLPETFTSNAGWNISKDKNKLLPLIEMLKKYHVRIILFMNPDSEEINKLSDLDIDGIELYTEEYANHFNSNCRDSILDKYKFAAKAAKNLGLRVNAGHDLNTENLSLFLKQVNCISEVSIGHSLISDALEHGFSATLRKYLAICNNS